MSLKTLFRPTAEVGEARRVALLGEAGKGTKGKLLVTGGVLIGAGAAIAAGPAAIGAAGAKLIPKTKTGKFLAGIAAPIAIAQVAKNEKAQQTILSIPKQTVNVEVGLINANSAQDVFNTIKANPYGAAVFGGAIVGAVGVTAAGAYSLLNTASVKQNTNAILESNAANASKDLIAANEKEYNDYIAKLKGTAENITPAPIPNPINKNNAIVSSPPATYADQNINKPQASTPVSTGSNSTAAGAPVNIQQNNYFGDRLSEKYINSKKNNV